MSVVNDGGGEHIVQKHLKRGGEAALEPRHRNAEDHRDQIVDPAESNANVKQSVLGVRNV